jgi:hypothetical protein
MFRERARCLGRYECMVSSAAGAPEIFVQQMSPRLFCRTCRLQTDAISMDAGPPLPARFRGAPPGLVPSLTIRFVAAETSARDQWVRTSRRRGAPCLIFVRPRGSADAHLATVVPKPPTPRYLGLTLSASRRDWQRGTLLDRKCALQGPAAEGSGLHLSLEVTPE